MPRHSRLDLPGAPQHATQRGNSHQHCFLCEQNSRDFNE
jgi:hypothetical protein